jgi:hypothetical protein
MVGNDPNFRIDKKISQVNKLRGMEYLVQMEADLNYHFVIETLGEDYEAIMGRPLAVHCHYPDIRSPYDFAFHVCLMGDSNNFVPTLRCYKKICYSVLSPLMKMFRININNIVLHKEVSDDKEMDCPGNLFDKHVLIAQLRNLLINK